jgi:putative addiction module component (TIGR02574 family)
MNQRVKTLLDEARKLSPAEREELAELLLDTVEHGTGLESAWGEEAQRRWNEHVEKGGETSDAFEAIEDVRRRLKTSGAG